MVVLTDGMSAIGHGASVPRFGGTDINLVQHQRTNPAISSSPATLMSASGPKQAGAFVPHMSAFGGTADMKDPTRTGTHVFSIVSFGWMTTVCRP